MTRREVMITELVQCLLAAPEIRVGQLLDFLNVLANARQNKNLADLDDDELVRSATVPGKNGERDRYFADGMEIVGDE